MHCWVAGHCCSILSSQRLQHSLLLLRRQTARWNLRQRCCRGRVQGPDAVGHCTGPEKSGCLLLLLLLQGLLVRSELRPGLGQLLLALLQEQPGLGCRILQTHGGARKTPRDTPMDACGKAGSCLGCQHAQVF